ncbi:MAG TPA: response regulator transcription factor [Vicinamibacterales bacterium]|nr:response regulator transcription factor [Vicinamibacterales bacterium]
MTRILLIDDHPIVRLGVRRILMDHFNPVFIGEAGDAEGGVAQALGEEWDVVVLDITMPGAVGLDVLKQIREQRSELPILVLSIHPANQFARRALAAGASGYLTKDTATSELVGAIEEVRRGRRYVNDAVKATMAPGARALATHEALSDREYQALRMLGSGRTVSEISEELGLSVKTVSTYRARVLQKLGMRTNAELMRYAMENGLLDS